MRSADPDWLLPGWGLPGVGGLFTTRAGGVSRPPFDSLNLRDGLGDDPAAVAINRQRLIDFIEARPVWLKQVHGAKVVRLTEADLRPGAPVHAADASVCTEVGVACAVQVADCLPVLFAAPGGVAAAHAGWRGLAAGVLEATVAALCEATDCAPAEIHVWLGPCIGRDRFEVGTEVLQAFGLDPDGPDRLRARPHAAGKWLVDLPQLARDRLAAAGVSRIRGGGLCSVSNAARFFSFRRDGVTGRMAGLAWLERR